MNWKEKLLVATSAFIPMSGALAAEVDGSNGLTGRRIGRRVCRRVSSVPVMLDPQTDQNLRVGVRLPAVKPSGARVGYSKIEISAIMTKVETGDQFLKVVRDLEPGQTGATIEFDLSDVYEPGAVSVDVQVVSMGDGSACEMARQPLTSFVLNGPQGRTFVPSVYVKLAPVVMNKAGGIGGPGGDY